MDAAPLPWKRTLYIVVFAQITSTVGFSSIFPFLPLYVDNLGASSGLSVEVLAGLVYSAQAFTMMLASPIWGALADRYGRKLMVERAMYGGAILLLLMAFVRSAEELVLLRALQGIVTGTFGAANALVVSQVPRDRTGYAMGLLEVARGLGIAIGPLIGGIVADALGYGPAFYVTAALLLFSGLLVTAGVQEGAREKRSPDDQPGLFTAWRRVVAAPGVAGTYSLRFLSELGRMMIVPVVPLFVQTLLTDSRHLNTFSGMVVSVSALASTASAVFLGRLGDRVGYRGVILVCTLFAALFYLPQSLVTTGWQLLALQALVGVALGGISPILSSLLASYTAPAEAGAAYGLDNSVNAGSRTVAPMLGAAVAVAYGLRATFVATGLLFLVSILIAIRLLPGPRPVVALRSPARLEEGR
jgi:DHA1 family multidrug resistance protein-like MFS transporter